MNNALLCLFVAVLGAGVVPAISAGDSDLYIGKFQSPDYSTYPDFSDVLKCMEYKDEVREKILQSKFTLEFKTKDAKTTSAIYTFSSPGGKDRQGNFEFGKEFDETLCDGRVSKTTISKQSSTQLTKDQKISGGAQAKWVGIFSPEELSVTVSCKDKSVTMKYKRV